MNKLKIILFWSIVISLLFLIPHSAIGLTPFSDSGEPVITAISEPPEISSQEGCYFGYQVNESDFNSLSYKEKAEILTDIDESLFSGVDIYIEYEGEIVKVLDEVIRGSERGLLWIITHPFGFGHYYVKVQKPDGTKVWYDVADWNGTLYQKWNNLVDDAINEWYTIDGESYAIANDKTPNSFSDRGLSFPIEVTDLPEGYNHYRQQWIERSGSEFDLTNEKLELIWEYAHMHNPEKGIDLDIDPVYFLAILAAEGTGSFDTLQGGPNPDFENDIENAARILTRELKDWENAGKPGDWLQWVNIGNADHIDPTTGRFIRAPKYKYGAGGYATDPHWWENVRAIYNSWRLQLP